MAVRHLLHDCLQQLFQSIAVHGLKSRQLVFKDGWLRLSLDDEHKSSEQQERAQCCCQLEAGHFEMGQTLLSITVL